MQLKEQVHGLNGRERVQIRYAQYLAHLVRADVGKGLSAVVRRRVHRGRGCACRFKLAQIALCLRDDRVGQAGELCNLDAVAVVRRAAATILRRNTSVPPCFFAVML